MKTKQILAILNFLAWVIFIALCLEAGGIFVSSAFWLAMPGKAEYLYKWNDLSTLYAYDKGHFIGVITIVSIVTMLKAYMFYLIIKLMSNKNLSFNQPFNTQVNRYILQGAVLAFVIGLLSKYGFEYAQWLSSKGIPMPDAAGLKLDGAHVWVLMSIILFVIAQVFKRGIELQQENELTV